MYRISSIFLVFVLISCTSEASYESFQAKDWTKIRIAQWNIGHFDFGNQPNSRIGPANYNRSLQQYREVLSQINADVLSVCEYSEFFGESETGNEYSKEVLFNTYSYLYEGHQHSFACNALFSQLDLLNARANSYRNLNTSYYYITADLPVGESVIKIVCAHLAFNSGDDQFALIQIKELLSEYANEEFVIMMGDWNIKEVDNYNLFANSGYQLANHGFWGDIPTFTDKKQVRNRILDNIMTKGLNIVDVSTIPNDLSDHFPIVVTIQLPKELVFQVSKCVLHY